jgi:hypothetical protein
LQSAGRSLDPFIGESPQWSPAQRDNASGRTWDPIAGETRPGSPPVNLEGESPGRTALAGEICFSCSC